ncbi:Tigger transposable element-derived protein 4 [Thelohanellus kitauei]|uniref:Tigger transposable element-derived protein 4 n=1 Tax=Thelohanellus kitauei TaxID=669202 RepID=A0A0C2MIH2_THEKT|nr:Tigger transposable element-derived protein 4 [Thelohanellus kitauei]
MFKFHESLVINQSSLLMENEKPLAQDINVKQFDSNNRFLERWKERNNITCKNGNYYGAEGWSRDAPPAVIKENEAKGILNADETELYSRAIPDEILSFKNNETAARKMDKERNTLLFACNMDRNEKLSRLRLEQAKTHSFL